VGRTALSLSTLLNMIKSAGESYRKPYYLNPLCMEQCFFSSIGCNFQLQQVLLVSCKQGNVIGSAWSSWVII